MSHLWIRGVLTRPYTACSTPGVADSCMKHHRLQVDGSPEMFWPLRPPSSSDMTFCRLYVKIWQTGCWCTVLSMRSRDAKCSGELTAMRPNGLCNKSCEELRCCELSFQLATCETGVSNRERRIPARAINGRGRLTSSSCTFRPAS